MSTAAGSLGFAASSALRLVAAIGYALAAGAVVWLVDGSPPAPNRDAARAPALTASRVNAIVTVEATYAVAQWTVQCAGRTLTPLEATPRRWRGQVTLDATGAEVFVQADNQDALSDAACALRLSASYDIPLAASAPSRIAWGEGFVATSLTIPGPKP